MGYYVDQNGNYYEGDKADHRHIDVSKKPSPFHVYNMETKRWAKDTDLESEAETNIKKSQIIENQLFIFKVFSQLVTKLIADGVISATAFDEETRAKYQEVKAIIDSM